MIRFTSDQVTVKAAADDGNETGERRIDAIAVHWNTFAKVSDGTEVMFKPGSLPEDGKNPRVFMYHDSTKVVGSVVERVSTDEAMLASMRITRTALGDEALVLAADNLMDVSVGVNVLEYTEDKQGRMIVTSAEWLELSLVPIPAFSGSIITDVAASATITEVAASAETNSDTPDTQEETTETVEETTVEATPAPAEAVEAAAIPTAPIPAQPKREFRMPSAGEYLAAMHIGGDTFAKVNGAFREAAMANRTVLQAAAGDQITTDTPGLLNQMVLGPLVQDLNFVRPVVQAVGARAYPDGGAQKTFIRPTIGTHTDAGVQSSELAPVTARTMVINANTIGKTTIAGSVFLSVQDIDFTSPPAMNQILTDLMGEAMYASDNLCADALLTAASASGTWDLTAADLVKSIYDAAADISNGRNWFPTHMLVSPDVWAQLGSAVDSTGSPLFPFVGGALSGMNRLGSQNAVSWNGNPLGLELVVDSNFAAKTMVITRLNTGNGDAFEYYESQRGIMSVEVPSKLGREFSYHLYASTFAAIPGMIRKIVQA
jgi:HK97 family phage prohead protease